MGASELNTSRSLWLLIAIATLFRLMFASLLDLSVDESYYWLYALYPDWSHFDHPPIVGFVIQLFTLNLWWDSEVMVRLGPTVFAAINTFIVFRIGMVLSDEIGGLYAALLYTSSIYLSVLSGIFIIPDTPQMLFWLVSLYLLLQCLPSAATGIKARKQMLLFGLSAGLAIYSKYHGVFLWAGALAYIVLYNRKWLVRPELYIAGLISLLFVAPIVYWNIEHDFISFGFHGERVAPQLILKPEYFVREIVGQVLYNNPVNFFIILSALYAWYKGRMQNIPSRQLTVLFLNAVPLWLVFTAFSLFRPTLPHWTGPAYTPLIFVAAVYLRNKVRTTHRVPISLKWAVGLVAVLSLVAAYIINFLPVGLGSKDNVARYGEGDFTQDMYGWQQVAKGFMQIRDRDVKSGEMPKDAPVISFRYFPAAFYDYYFAVDNDIDVLVMGPPEKAHNYVWINQIRGGLEPGADAYSLVVSNWYSDPQTDFGPYFERIEPPEVYEITRSGTVVRYGLVYRMRNYTGNFDFEGPKIPAAIPSK